MSLKRPKVPKFIVYRDRKREWRWQVVAPNGRIIADSGEGYKRRGDCTKGLVSFTNYMRSYFPIGPIAASDLITIRDAE